MPNYKNILKIIVCVSILTFSHEIASFAEEMKASNEKTMVPAKSTEASAQAAKTQKTEPKAVVDDAKIFVKNGMPCLTVTGRVAKVDMVAIKGVWEEYALLRPNGETIILIGEKTNELKDSMDKDVTISGALKPRLRYAGNLTRTIEIQEIVTPETKEKVSK